MKVKQENTIIGDSKRREGIKKRRMSNRKLNVDWKQASTGGSKGAMSIEGARRVPRL